MGASGPGLGNGAGTPRIPASIKNKPRPVVIATTATAAARTASRLLGKTGCDARRRIKTRPRVEQGLFQLNVPHPPPGPQKKLSEINPRSSFPNWKRRPHH